MGRMIPISLVLAVALFAAGCEPAYAGDKVTCKQWALMVQQFDSMPPPTRAKWADQLASAPRNSERVRIALKALNYITAGGAPSDAWRQCPSI